MISIRKRGKVYQYCFEAGKVNGKRKQITKSGFKIKNEDVWLNIEALVALFSIDRSGIVRHIKFIKMMN